MKRNKTPQLSSGAQESYKVEIKKILISLRRLGYSREAVEAGIGCADQYILQAMSRGGNAKLLDKMRNYHDEQVRLRNITDVSDQEYILALRAQMEVITERLIKLESLVRNVSEKEILKDLKQSLSVKSKQLKAAPF